jgi:8-oxo-dGTP pyrophosphatase MutT (NUDIX family)
VRPALATLTETGHDACARQGVAEGRVRSSDAEGASRQVETRTRAPAYPAAHAFPVSVKGVAVQAGKVLLLENERNEWELPGGKLELGEDPADCVVREIREETGWQVTAGPLLDCWQYHIREGSDVVIVTYGCPVLSTDPPVVSSEHKRAGLFAPAEVPGLVMPDGYKHSITAWCAGLNGGPAAP